MGKALFWTPDDGGSRRYRCDLPAEALAQRGHDVHVSDNVTASWAKDATVIVQRPFDPARLERIGFLRQVGCRVILDWDDDYLNVDERADPDVYRHYLQPAVRDRIRQALRSVDAVVAATPRLANVALQHGAQRVHQVGNGLPARVLNHPCAYPGTRQLVVGWTGSPNTAAEFSLVARQLRRFLSLRRDRGDVLLRTVGVPAAWLRDQLLGDRQYPVGREQLDPVPWTDDFEHYLSVCASFDVWLAPYRDVPFNQAKYPTKALEAAFLGVPLVASNIEPYRRAIFESRAGYLVRDSDPHMWGRHLLSLVDSYSTRRLLSTAGRDWAALQICEALAFEWERVLWPDREQV